MKITPDHLARGAFIYVRQSTADQLANNHENRRRQYDLAERARALGWTDVTVIDDDLGRSGSGVIRPGFERLLAAICEGRVGAVFPFIEASRLARNGRDWHTLIEFCGLVGALIVEEDGTYSAQDPNDRLLLGMKGTMSEFELSLLRARSMEALRQKARRGELFSTVAVGYVRMGRGMIELDSDLRVREAIGLVFARFAEMQSIRQVFPSLRADRIALPYIDHRHPGGGGRCGSFRSTRRWTISLSTRSMSGPTPSARPAAGQQSRTAASACCAAVTRPARTGRSCWSTTRTGICLGRSTRGTSG